MSYEDDEQIAFRDLLEEMEATERAAIDEHRTLVQRWFDTLPQQHKQELGMWLHRKEWITFQALSAAAGDYHRSVGAAEYKEVA
jgi:hypothetical protein